MAQGLSADIYRNRINPRRNPHVANAAFIVVVSERNADIRRAWQETASLTHRIQAFEQCSSATLCRRIQQQ
jgi:hypothetical protein